MILSDPSVNQKM